MCTRVIHLGASWRGREGAEDRRSPPSGTSISNPFNDELFRYRARGADLHLADRFVSTPQVFNEDQFWGVEGAVIWGPVHVVGEYTQLEGDIARARFPGTPPLLCCNGKDPTYDPQFDALDAMKKPTVVAGIRREDMRPQRVA